MCPTLNKRLGRYSYEFDDKMYPSLHHCIIILTCSGLLSCNHMSRYILLLTRTISMCICGTLKIYSICCIISMVTSGKWAMQNVTVACQVVFYWHQSLSFPKCEFCKRNTSAFLLPLHSTNWHDKFSSLMGLKDKGARSEKCSLMV